MEVNREGYLLSSVNIEHTERAILSLLTNKPELCDRIDEASFISKEGKTYFNAIKHLIDTNVPVNTRSVFLQVQKTWSTCNHSEVSKFFDTKIDIAEEEFLVNHLYENKHKDELRKLSLELTSELAKNSDIDWDNVSTIGEQIQYYKSMVMGEQSQIEYMPELMIDFAEEIERRQLNDEYWDTGCSHLNRILFDGFMPGTMTTIAGSPGTGKSTYALYLVNKQINKQVPSLYFSLEMPKMSVLDKMMGQRLDKELKDFRPKSEEGLDELVSALLEKEGLRLSHNDKFGMVSGRTITLSELERIISEFKKKIKSDYCVVTIDLVTMIYEFNKSVNKANDYEHAENVLHAIAVRQNVHIVQVVQLRRPSEKVSIKTIDDIEKLRPTKEMIKNSGGIEERSRVILGIHFPLNHAKLAFGNDDPYLDIMDSDIEVQVLKQNMGAIGDVLYYDFHPEKSRLMPVYREHKRVKHDVPEANTNIKKEE